MLFRRPKTPTRMRVAIVHYHLKRGGVTRVIESALAAFDTLETPPDVVVLTGEVPDDVSFKDRCRVIEGLRYSNAQERTPGPKALKKELQKAAKAALGGDPDIWHIHNHSLGKNSSVPSVVEQLAKDGAGLLLQMHDFAEDGRPENFQLNKERDALLYPTGARIHYACINGRDYAYFACEDLNKSQLHLVPNAVGDSPEQPTEECTKEILAKLECEKLILYPVRAVRRKNFGELLLWAACAPGGTALATTLGPTNSNFVETYNRWKALATELELPVRFGIGEDNDWAFEAIVNSADAILTTSIAEGFGLAYLEPWLFGKPIIGRNLPPITEDFERSGLELSGLYNSLKVPVSWVDETILKGRIADQLTTSYETYGKALPAGAIDQAIEGITPEPGFIDFGGLDELLQASVIRLVQEDPTARAIVAEQILPLIGSGSAESISANAERIRSQYNLDAYGKRLVVIYERIIESKKSSISSLGSESLLAHYLRPESFRLLRT